MAQPTIEGTGHGIPRMLFASDGSDWYAILVDSDGHVKIDVVTSALPTDAAKETKQDTMITALQLIDDLRNALGSVATDLVRVESEDGDKIFGFESIVEEQVEELNLAAGINALDGTNVPAGKIWKITQVSIRYIGTITGVNLYIFAFGLATSLVLLHQVSPVNGTFYCWNGEVYLQAGDRMRLYITGATLNDDAVMRYAGVQMNAP